MRGQRGLAKCAIRCMECRALLRRTHLARRSVEEPPIPRHVQSPHLTPIASQTQWPASYGPASFSTHGTGFNLFHSSHWQGRSLLPRRNCGGQGGRATATHYHSLCPSTHRSSSFPASLLPRCTWPGPAETAGARLVWPARLQWTEERAGGGEEKVVREEAWSQSQPQSQIKTRCSCPYYRHFSSSETIKWPLAPHDRSYEFALVTQMTWKSMKSMKSDHIPILDICHRHHHSAYLSITAILLTQDTFSQELLWAKFIQRIWMRILIFV